MKTCSQMLIVLAAGASLAWGADGKPVQAKKQALQHQETTTTFSDTELKAAAVDLTPKGTEKAKAATKPRASGMLGDLFRSPRAALEWINPLAPVEERKPPEVAMTRKPASSFTSEASHQARLVLFTASR